jgi:hypothetical protein
LTTLLLIRPVGSAPAPLSSLTLGLVGILPPLALLCPLFLLSYLVLVRLHLSDAHQVPYNWFRRCLALVCLRDDQN